MFFKKKNNQCNVNKNLKECDSINKIREWQTKLDSLKGVGYREAIVKFLQDNHIIDKGLYEETLYSMRDFYDIDGVTTFIDRVTNWRKDEKTIRNDIFLEFGKCLNEIYNKNLILDDLNNKISKEKQKLGIK